MFLSDDSPKQRRSPRPTFHLPGELVGRSLERDAYSSDFSSESFNKPHPTDRLAVPGAQTTTTKKGRKVARGDALEDKKKLHRDPLKIEHMKLKVKTAHGDVGDQLPGLNKAYLTSDSGIIEEARAIEATNGIDPSEVQQDVLPGQITKLRVKKEKVKKKAEKNVGNVCICENFEKNVGNVGNVCISVVQILSDWNCQKIWNLRLNVFIMIKKRCRSTYAVATTQSAL